MKLIVGLGNPSKKYEKTRHNIGFILLDFLAKEYDAKFKLDSSSKSEIAELMVDGEKLLLCKPQTFMNLSGQSVSYLVNYYKLTPSDILIVQDEIDLPFGKIKLSANSGSAGHKGIQSIIDQLGTRDFRRIRFGINQEKNTLPTEVFVLKNFSKEEQSFIETINPKETLVEPLL